MKTIVGTCYFPTKADAIKYYAEYESDAARAVEIKLKEGSIHIGKPALKPGQKAFIRDHRWHIED